MRKKFVTFFTVKKILILVPQSVLYFLYQTVIQVPSIRIGLHQCRKGDTALLINKDKILLFLQERCFGSSGSGSMSVKSVGQGTDTAPMNAEPSPIPCFAQLTYLKIWHFQILFFKEANQTELRNQILFTCWISIRIERMRISNPDQKQKQTLPACVC